MENTFTKSNPYNIVFVGRLDEEKWTKLLLECIKKTMIHTIFGEIVGWHIIGKGEDDIEFESLASRFPGRVTVYGQRDKTFIDSLFPKMQLSFVPSVFLETFWLVALEALSAWVPVCGFKKWGLIPFIPDTLALSETNSADSFLKILEHTIESGFPEKPDLSLYDATLWKEELKLITKDKNTILIVHDYLAPIGGAEMYVALLKRELMSLGKTVRFFGYHGDLPKWKRILFGIMSPFSFWHAMMMKKMIAEYNPDAIWLNNISRYVWPWWLKEVVDSGKSTIITHHDLGLITARPSQITDESHIPKSLNYQDFVRSASSPLEYLARVGKYLTLKIFWRYLTKVGLHLVPSDFMKPYFENFGAKQVEVFPHSILK